MLLMVLTCLVLQSATPPKVTVAVRAREISPGFPIPASQVAIRTMDNLRKCLANNWISIVERQDDADVAIQLTSLYFDRKDALVLPGSGSIVGKKIPPVPPHAREARATVVLSTGTLKKTFTSTKQYNEPTSSFGIVTDIGMDLCYQARAWLGDHPSSIVRRPRK
jgi:hypothetical protein